MDKLTFFVFGLITVLSSCNITSEESGFSNKTKCLKLKFSYPILTPDLLLVNFPDSQYIVYEQGYTVHKIPYTLTYLENEFDEEGEVLKDSIIAAHNKNRYLVYKEGESYGYKYDSVSSQEKTLVKVDSFLASAFRIHEELLSTKTDLLVQKTILADSNFYEKYYRTVKTNEQDPDTLYLFFSQYYNDYKFSLSPKLDSMKQAKLIGITFLYNAKNGNKDDINSYSREVTVQLKEASFEEVEEVRQIIEKVKSLKTR